MEDPVGKWFIDGYKLILIKKVMRTDGDYSLWSGISITGWESPYPHNNSPIINTDVSYSTKDISGFHSATEYELYKVAVILRCNDLQVKGLPELKDGLPTNWFVEEIGNPPRQTPCMMYTKALFDDKEGMWTFYQAMAVVYDGKYLVTGYPFRSMPSFIENPNFRIATLHDLTYLDHALKHMGKTPCKDIKEIIELLHENKNKEAIALCFDAK